jgi:hypothetical protein
MSNFEAVGDGAKLQLDVINLTGRCKLRAVNTVSIPQPNYAILQVVNASIGVYIQKLYYKVRIDRTGLRAIARLLPNAYHPAS